MPSSADTLHLGNGACGASPADVSADTGIPFGIGKPAFQGNGYWSCAAEGKGANGVVTAYVFKSACQDIVTQGKGAPVFNPGFESKGKWSFAAEGKGKCSPAHVFNPAFTGPWNLAAKGETFACRRLLLMRARGHGASHV